MLPTRGLGKLVVFARICLRTVCKLYKLLHLFNAELFYSWREWQRWRTAGGIQCSFCRHCLKTAQPALSSLRTTPTVWGWVHQVLLATCLWASWGRITAELLSLKVSLSSEEMPYLSTYYSPCYFFFFTHNYCFVSPLEILIIIMSLSSRLVSILPALLPAKWVRKGSVCAAWYDGARWALWVSRVFPRSHHVSGSA